MPRNRSKPKMRLKTHRGAKKRFKVTATGKILRMHSGKRHLLGTKKPGRMRKLKKLTLVSPADRLNVKLIFWKAFQLQFIEGDGVATKSRAQARAIGLKSEMASRQAALHGCLPADN